MGPQPAFSNHSTAEEVTLGLDLSGRVVIITGANSGLGEETARVLVLRGASVVMAVRNTEAGEKAKARILGSLKAQGKGPADGAPDRLSVMHLDVSSKASVRQFCDSFLAQSKPLHILINNAGIMMTNFALSKDGYEMQMASNHLGHFMLTELLLPKLKESAVESGQESRVVIVSSSMHQHPYPKVGIRFDAINDPKGYSKGGAYGQSKLANLLHARELARRLKEEGAPVTANALHPGVIKTQLFNNVLPKNSVEGVVFSGLYALVFKWFWKTVPEGAATQCFAAVHPSLNGVSGKYLQDARVAEEAASAMSRDESMARRLWEFSTKFAFE